MSKANRVLVSELIESNVIYLVMAGVFGVVQAILIFTLIA